MPFDAIVLIEELARATVDSDDDRIRIEHTHVCNEDLMRQMFWSLACRSEKVGMQNRCVTFTYSCVALDFLSRMVNLQAKMELPSQLGDHSSGVEPRGQYARAPRLLHIL